MLEGAGGSAAVLCHSWIAARESWKVLMLAVWSKTICVLFEYPDLTVSFSPPF